MRGYKINDTSFTVNATIEFERRTQQPRIGTMIIICVTWHRIGEAKCDGVWKGSYVAIELERVNAQGDIINAIMQYLFAVPLEQRELE